MSASIFHKICGQCMAQVPVAANACACGYSFAGETDSRTQELVRQVADERAYETYLEARLQQTLDHLRAVREADTRDKWDREQDKKVQEALQALKLARDALNAQRRKTAETEDEAKQWRALRGSSKKARARRRSGSTRTVEATTHTVKTMELPPPTVERDDTVAPRTTKQPATTTVRIPAPKVLRAPASPLPRPLAPPTERARTMPAIEGFAAVKNLPAVLDPASTATAARREQRMCSAPTESFRQLQSSLAQRLYPAAVEPAHHCPHCTATVPADATRCGCGHELKSGDTMPAFTWPADEPSSTGINGKPLRRRV